MMILITSRLRHLWRNIAGRAATDRALDDELRTYVDLVAAEHERAGLSPDEARRAALLSLGGMQQVKEATRDQWVGASLDAARRELRYAVRTLRRAPTFVAVAVVSLGLGIGGATAVFTVIKGSLLRALPGAADADRLITIEGADQRGPVGEVSYPDYRDIATQATSLAGVSGFNGTSLWVDDGSTRARHWVSFVTDDFFETLGVRPVVGRFWNAASIAQDGTSDLPLVLGYTIWQQRFNGTKSVIGRRLKLNDVTYTVVGIAPPHFVGGMTTHAMELFVPMAPGGVTSSLLRGIDLTSRRETWLRLVARLAPDATIDGAQRELAGIGSRLAATYAATNTGRSFVALPRTGMTAEERADVSRVPRLLFAAVLLLLLIACGNVATLALVRESARRRELATRVALGASHGALVRQVAFEGGLIALGAGIVGVLLARGLVGSATLVGSVIGMSEIDLSLDGRVLLVALAASTATAMLVSALPAARMFRVLPGEVLKDGAGGALRRSRRGQGVLVGLQVGMSLVMLASAAMLYGALHRVLAAHDGSAPAAVRDAGLEVEEAIADTVGQLEFYRELLARLGQEPSVDGAALASTIPPFQWSGTTFVFRRGEAPPAGASADERARTGVRVNAIEVSDAFFGVMKIRIESGRTFTPQDTRGTPMGAVISHRLAQLLWPGQDAVGRTLAWPPLEGPARPPLTVIGVVADTPDPTLSAPPPLAVYLSFAQWPRSNLILLARARPGAVVTAPMIRRLVASVNPRVTVSYGRSVSDRLWEYVRPQRTASAWIGVFGAIALLLSAMGLYGVVAQGVVQRRRELAVRAALGATPAGVVREVMIDGVRVAAVGLVGGTLVSVGAVRVLRAFFSGVVVSDPRPTLVAAAVLGAAMLCAAYVPARRAARLNAAELLRTD